MGNLVLISADSMVGENRFFVSDTLPILTRIRRNIHKNYLKGQLTEHCIAVLQETDLLILCTVFDSQERLKQRAKRSPGNRGSITRCNWRRQHNRGRQILSYDSISWVCRYLFGSQSPLSGLQHTLIPAYFLASERRPRKWGS